MAAQLLSFFRPAPQTRGDWSNQELAEFYRVESALIQAGISVETDRGCTDEGDPWFVFCRTSDLEVIVHFARVDGLYVIAAQHLPHVLRGTDFRKLLNEVASRNPSLMPVPPQAKGKILLHPAALLAAVVATLFINGSSSEAVAAEMDAGEALALVEQDGSINLVADASLQDDSWLHRKTAMIAAVVMAAVSIDQGPISVSTDPITNLEISASQIVPSSLYSPIADPNIIPTVVQRADTLRSDRLDIASSLIQHEPQHGQWQPTGGEIRSEPVRELTLAQIEQDLPEFTLVPQPAVERILAVESATPAAARLASASVAQASVPVSADTQLSAQPTKTSETSQNPLQPTPGEAQQPKEAAPKSITALTVELVKLGDKAQHSDDLVAASAVELVKTMLFDLRPLKTSHAATESTQKASLLVAERDADAQNGKSVGLSTAGTIDTRDALASLLDASFEDRLSGERLAALDGEELSDPLSGSLTGGSDRGSSSTIDPMPETASTKLADTGTQPAAQAVIEAKPAVLATPPTPIAAPKPVEPVPTQLAAPAPPALQSYDAAADSLVKAFVKTTVSLNVVTTSGNIILLDADTAAFSHHRFTVKTWALNDGSTLSIVGVMPELGSLFG